MRPSGSVGIEAFAGKEEVFEPRQVVLLHELAVRVVPLDRAERRWRGEHDLDVVLGDDPPEGACIRRADGLPSYSTVVQPVRSGA